MPQLPVISGKEFIKFLQTVGFIIARVNGSHFRLKHPDGRITTVPVHKKEDLPKGLMRKIIREDLELEQEEFLNLFEQYKSKRK
jgi:predicted RNA binding protein YcfA (HicA-like mRNA interferase family)